LKSELDYLLRQSAQAKSEKTKPQPEEQKRPTQKRLAAVFL
jgi:hypothetical protein